MTSIVIAGLDPAIQGGERERCREGDSFCIIRPGQPEGDEWG